jgi:hypothetical protein
VYHHITSFRDIDEQWPDLLGFQHDEKKSANLRMNKLKSLGGLERVTVENDWDPF